MMRKLLLAGLTTGALALGMGTATAPANAYIYFGIGGPPMWHPHRWHPQPRCTWVWRHHRKHWVCW